MSMGKFNIKVNERLKTVESSVEGVISVSEAQNFIKEYNKIISGILANEYILKFDCTKLSVSPKESQEKLTECFKLYKDSNFKKVIFNVGSNSILKMQLKRLAQTIDFKNYEIN